MRADSDLVRLPQAKGDALRPWVLATVALVVAYGALCLLVFRDYGITYDETWEAALGQRLLAWYTSGFQDRSFETIPDIRYYGGLFTLPAEWLAPLSGMDHYEFRHLFNVPFAIATVAGAARLAGRLAGPRAAFFAALLLITTPRFFGHGFANPKDIPLAACHMWAIDSVVAYLMHLPRPGWPRIVRVGLFAGLAIAVRVSAAVVGLYMIVGLALWLVRAWRQSAPSSESGGEALLPQAAAFFGHGLAAAGIALATALPFWPYLQVDPIRNGLRLFDRSAQGTYRELDVLFDGQILTNMTLPASYVWVWLSLVQPETYAVALLLAGASAVHWWRRSRAFTPRAIGWVVTGLAATLPFLVASLTRAHVYDGIRHFLFCSSMLAVPAGAGLAWAWRAELPAVVGRMLAAVVIVCFGLTIADMVTLHPYQSTYFNRIVAGGLPGAAGRFETDYWGSSMQEAALWLRSHADELMAPEGAIRVVSSGFPTQTEHHLPPPRFHFVGSVDHAPPEMLHPWLDPPDFYIATTRKKRDEFCPGTLVHRVERQGVTLAVVVRVDREASLELGRGLRTP